MAKEIQRKERFAGCMLGAAMGDALGYKTKTLTRKQIKETYGKKGLIKYAPEKNQEETRISDETQLMLFTAHGLLWADEKDKKNADRALYVFYAYQQWLYSQTGNTATEELQWVIDDEKTGFACEMLDMEEMCKKRSPTKQLLQTLADLDENTYGTAERQINQSKMFDCVPRVAPAGLYCYKDPEKAFSLGCELAAITHTLPAAYLAAGCFAAILAYVCGGSTIEQAVSDTLILLKAREGGEDCAALLEKAMSLLDSDTSPLTDVAELGGGTDADSCLAIGVYCACVHYEYNDALFLAVNQDGNSDACAFIAGALKGALLGYKALPAKWIKQTQFAELIKDYALKLSKASKQPE